MTSGASSRAGEVAFWKRMRLLLWPPAWVRVKSQDVVKVRSGNDKAGPEPPSVDT